jgi:hypothetical protein
MFREKLGLNLSKLAVPGAAKNIVDVLWEAMNKNV